MLPMPRRQDQIPTERERERGTFLSLNHQKGSLLKGCRYSTFAAKDGGNPSKSRLRCCFVVHFRYLDWAAFLRLMPVWSADEANPKRGMEILLLGCYITLVECCFPVLMPDASVV